MTEGTNQPFEGTEPLDQSIKSLFQGTNNEIEGINNSERNLPCEKNDHKKEC